MAKVLARLTAALDKGELPWLLTVGVALLVFFMALKPTEMGSRHDSMVVVMLGFFLLLTHYFYLQSISTGLWLIASTLLC